MQPAAQAVGGFYFNRYIHPYRPNFVNTLLRSGAFI